LPRHPYKCLAKTIYRVFYPVFALLEYPGAEEGQKTVAQRKLLYLEKLFASLLLAAPMLQDQLENRIDVIQRRVEASQDTSTEVARKANVQQQNLLTTLVALKELLQFWLPAVFRAGWMVRCCTWEGRAAGTALKARQLLEEILVQLVHLLDDYEAKNEYIRTLAVALLTWQPWTSSLPGVCFAEESCEALLSRMSNRCEVYNHVHGFDATFDLFLTLPPPKRGARATRGMLRRGLVQLFQSRIRRVVFSEGGLPYAAPVAAKTMHGVFTNDYPVEFTLPGTIAGVTASTIYHKTLYCALRSLSTRTGPNTQVEQFLSAHVARRTDDDILLYDRAHEDLTQRLHAALGRKKRPTRSAPRNRSRNRHLVSYSLPPGKGIVTGPHSHFFLPPSLRPHPIPFTTV
jgi:hypothetical protein